MTEPVTPLKAGEMNPTRLKAEHGDGLAFIAVNLRPGEKQDFCFRAPTAEEFEAYTAATAAPEQMLRAQLSLCLSCVLYPSPDSAAKIFQKAVGLPTNIVNKVMTKLTGLTVEIETKKFESA